MTSAVQASRLSKDDYKKAKELEEARKAGTAPPEVDEDGNAVNPHIPSYIANAPCTYNYYLVVIIIINIFIVELFALSHRHRTVSTY